MIQQTPVIPGFAVVCKYLYVRHVREKYLSKNRVFHLVYDCRVLQFYSTY